MRGKTRLNAIVIVLFIGGSPIVEVGCSTRPKGVATDPAVKAQKFPEQKLDSKIDQNANEMIIEGRKIFRYDTFGSEAFWGDQLQLHKAILRKEKGGVGDGLPARAALQLGLKADTDKIPKLLV